MGQKIPETEHNANSIEPWFASWCATSISFWVAKRVLSSFTRCPISPEIPSEQTYDCCAAIVSEGLR